MWFQVLPFNVRMFESNFQPPSDGEPGLVTLSVHYVANEPLEVRWTVQNDDIGIDFTGM